MKIGLTGSIACGKSTVSQYLRQKGCFIVDADAISRALTADGGAALPEIRRAFGDDVFSGASLDRAKLGQLVFADAQKRETLNAILHPMILSEIRRQLDRLDAPGQIVVGDVPLLFECGMESMFDTVWVVRAARETQIQRLFERDGLSREQAERRNALHKELKPLQQKYAALEGELEKAMNEQSDVETQLADPAVYTDGARSTELLKRFNELRDLTERLMEDMAALEEQIAAIEARRADIDSMGDLA